MCGFFAESLVVVLVVTFVLAVMIFLVDVPKK